MRVGALLASFVGVACYAPRLGSDESIQDASDPDAPEIDGATVADARADAACDDGDPCTVSDQLTDGGCRGTSALSPSDCVGAVVTTQNGSCYAFCPSARTWAEGRDDCAAAEWTLVTIDDGVENNWISTSFQVELWIGLFQDAASSDPSAVGDGCPGRRAPIGPGRSPNPTTTTT